MTGNLGLEASQAEMDGEHRIQIGLISALETALGSGASIDEVRTLVEQLVDLSDVHFMSEQVLMRFSAYPDIRRHELEHDSLMETLQRIQAAFDLNDADVMTAESRVMRELLLAHIRTHDFAFALFLNSAAVPV